MGKRIIVTGATGFIGRHTLPNLTLRGWEVHALTLRKGMAPIAGVCWHYVDLMDLAGLRRVMSSVSASHLLHLAWYTEPGKFWNAVENFAWVTASMGLIEAFHENGGRRAVIAGSCAEYDWNYGYCVEGVTPLAPTTIYGTCKNALRQLASAFARQATDMQLAWGRIFYLYGPHETPGRLFPAVASALLRGEEARCTHGNQIRDFLHVEDVASAFSELVDSKEIGAFNVCSGQPIALRQVMERIAAELRRPHLLKLGALPVPEDEPLFIVGDNRRLRMIGWRPTCALEEGISRTAAWWREQQVQSRWAGR